MSDFMEYSLRKYYETIGWSEENYYSSLCAVSNNILAFRMPVGLNLALGKSISPFLRSAYSIGVPERRSIGFLFSSVPVDMPRQPVLDEPFSRGRRADLVSEPTMASSFSWLLPGRLSGAASGQQEQQPQLLKYPFLLFGRVFEDLRLESLYSQNFNKDTMLIVSSLSDWHWKINHETMSSDNSNASTELYYTAKERSGGVSLGARFKKEYGDGVASVLTCVANPIMGHLSASYATTVAKDLQMATRYDFNTYSFDADLSVGVEYAPSGKDQVLKGRLSLAEGLSVRFDGRFQDAIYSLGMSTGFGPSPRQTFGVQLQL
ncbi:hypothetical protein BC831DRAFT_399492 [Entophlyctis helioformis]|nr:hypothetical protein BC831DRAFT_399492 [Entophlyctis helioformis]